MIENEAPSPATDEVDRETAAERSQDFAIVGVGASAGGLEALNRMFGAAPQDCPLCFVVVQHLSPDYPSMVAELLGKQTRLRVIRASDGVTLEPGTVYVVEPQTTLQVRGSQLVVEPQTRDGSLRLPIDILFRSLAEEQGGRAVCVVLSGTGSDGTRGARAIKEQGGIVIAQDPETCGFSGMPVSIVEAGLADIVRPPEQIVEHLMRLNQPGDEASLITTEKPIFEKILNVLTRHSDIDFGLYKPATIARRIEKRLRLMRFDSSEEYYRLLRSDENEVEQLIDDLLIGVTRFFRDPAGVTALQAALRAQLGRMAPSDEPLRIWVCGCSTGEEAYTVAVAVSEVLSGLGSERSFRMFATDVNASSIERAARGRYPAAAMAEVPAHLLRKYFTHEPSGGYSLKKEIRDRILFSRHNVLRDPPFSNLDVICCRNLLIYFRAHVQARVAQVFGFALRAGGLLWLGSSEGLGAEDGHFDLVDSKWRVFRSKGVRSKEVLSVRSFPLVKREARSPLSTLSLPHARRAGDEMVELHRGLERGLLPPHVVVDEEMQLVYRDGDLGNLLKVPAGSSSHDVRAMLPEDLGLLLVTAWGRVAESGDDFIYRGLQINVEGEEKTLSLRIRRVVQTTLKRKLMAVFFEAVETAPVGGVEVELVRVPEDIRTHIRALEEELGNSRSELQSTVEELESSNEELQSTNEELLASNEELQSVNEELQSVNEELHTVNSEYQAKLEELSISNADLKTLLTGLDVGVVFLDANLSIRRFSPRASELIHVLDQDVGRPFAHINHGLGTEEMTLACKNAMEKSTATERSVLTRDGRELRVRIVPVSAEATGIGVVVTVTDLSRLDRTPAADRQLLDALEAAGLPAALLDREGRVRSANGCLAKVFGRDPRWLEGTSAASLLSPTDQPRFLNGLVRAWNGETWEGRFRIDVPGDRAFDEDFSLCPLRDVQGQVRAIARVTRSHAAIN